MLIVDKPTVAVGHSGVRVALLFVMMCCFALSCRAEETGNEGQAQQGLRLPPRQTGPAQNASKSRSQSASSTLWTTGISLAIIVGGLLVASRWLKPYIGASRGLSIEAIEVLGRKAIDQKVAIHLVRCGRRILVLGVSAEGARTLSEITEPNEVQRLINACHGESNEQPAVTFPDASPAQSTSRTSALPPMTAKSEGVRRA